MKSWKGDWCDFAKGFVTWIATSEHRPSKSCLYGILYGKGMQISVWLLLLGCVKEALLPIHVKSNY